MVCKMPLNGQKNITIKLLRTVGFYKNTPAPLEHPFFPPLALGILFSQLKKAGYTISQDDLSIRVHHSIFDKNSNQRFKYELFFQKMRILQYGRTGADDEVEHELETLLCSAGIDGADIFLLSVPESPQNPSNILFLIALAKFLKKKYHAHIVVGGDPVSINLLHDHYDVRAIIDYIVIGKGEIAVLEAVEGIIQNRDNPESGEVSVLLRHRTEKIVVPDFSDLALNKYQLSFLDYRDFSSNGIVRDFFTSGTSMLLFQFTNGCPSKCAFCSASGQRMGPLLKPEEVVDALDRLQRQCNPTGFFFLSDTVNISKVYIKRICELIIKNDLNILWTACARVDGLDEEILAKMRAAGCIRLVIGMETASTALLGNVHKGISIQELEKVLPLASKYGIWIGLEVICGLPHETDDDINATIDFLLENKDHIDMTYVAVFDLREGSLMYFHPADYGIENIRELNLYRQEDSRDSNITNFVRFGFDEIDGLRWEDKQKQMVDSFAKVRKAIARTHYPNPFLGEHLLFYLYSRFSDKSKIKQAFYDAAQYLG